MGAGLKDAPADQFIWRCLLSSERRRGELHTAPAAAFPVRDLHLAILKSLALRCNACHALPQSPSAIPPL